MASALKIPTGLLPTAVYKFNWNVPNFYLLQETPHRICTQCFSVDNESSKPDHYKWTMGLFDITRHPGGYTFRIGCRLQKTSGTATGLFVRFTVKLKGCFKFTETMRVNSNGLVGHYEPYKMSDSDYKKYIDSNGTMNLNVQLEMLEPRTLNLESAYGNETGLGTEVS